MNTNLRKLTTIGLLCALAYIVMFVVRIPVVLFLKYEPKDVIITIGGFIMGPMTAFIVSVIVSIIEMLTVSDTGLIGFVMNIISSCSFACVASLFYKYKRNLKGAIIGLLSGTFVMVIIMLLWNYLITPLYMHVPRSEVIKLLLPAILPFNLLKGFLNAAITFLLYKPIIHSLRNAGLVEKSVNTKTNSVGFTLVAILIVVTCILTILVFRGIL